VLQFTPQYQRASPPSPVMPLHSYVQREEDGHADILLNFACVGGIWPK
jgi:hypothetical protein